MVIKKTRNKNIKKNKNEGEKVFHGWIKIINDRGKAKLCKC